VILGTAIASFLPVLRHPLRIGQVAPLYESVPPRRYGGTERVVAYLTEALVDLGHEVTLYASGDSVTSARLVPGAPEGLRLSGVTGLCAQIQHVLQLEQVIADRDGLDVIHFHTEPLQQSPSRHLGLPALTTLHGRLDLPEYAPLFDEFHDHPLVSISDDQRRPLPRAPFIATVHHGLPDDLYRFSDGPGDYLAFLGRISPEKRPDRAIEIARRSGIPLLMAAKIDDVDRVYYEEQIAPLIAEGGGVELIGEIDDADKQAFLGHARALLFPIDWPEPFGLVMIEALACGTPVIAWPTGSVPEVLTHRETGFLVDDVDAAVAAVADLGRLSRRHCRAVFDERFTAQRMASDYVDLYQRLRVRDAARVGAA
jgi:glycosyltransferase involved in cell wall biosynthesis